jgi:plastocyanin
MFMRMLTIFAVAAAALAAPTPALAATKTVSITAAGFVPSRVTIAVGDTVTWTNANTVVHRVVFDSVPCNLTVQPAGSGSCVFRAGGTHRYTDPSTRGNRFRGTVEVTGPRRSVTLQASRPAVGFGGSVTLSGFVSNQQSGESVVVFAQECGKTEFTRVAGVTSTTDGAWTLAVKPTINTVYQARWRTRESQRVTVAVRPAIRLRRVRSRFTVQITAAQSFAGKAVAYQRHNRRLRRWVTIRRVVLRTASGPVGTVVTSATFRARPRRGLRLRVVLPQAQAGACYLAAASNTIRT